MQGVCPGGGGGGVGGFEIALIHVLRHSSKFHHQGTV